MPLSQIKKVLDIRETEGLYDLKCPISNENSLLKDEGFPIVRQNARAYLLYDKSGMRFWYKLLFEAVSKLENV